MIHNTSPSASVALTGLGFAVPGEALPQSQALNFMLARFGSDPDRAKFLQKVYEGSAIKTRHSVIQDWRGKVDNPFFPELEVDSPPDGVPGPGTALRNELFTKEARGLGRDAAIQALSDAGVDAGSVTHLITVSCTGMAAPGLEYSLVVDLGLPLTVERFNIGFMGCYAAFPAMRLADSLVKANPEATVLIVIVELCSLHFQTLWESESVVAGALFSDGASAGLVQSKLAAQKSNKPYFLLRSLESRIVPNSEKRMAWTLGDHGFSMRLSAYVPKVLETNIKAVLGDACAAAGLDPDDVDAWAVHPGGRAILDRCADALGKPRDVFAASYKVLENFGNMSAATLFFVFDELRTTLGAKPTAKNNTIFSVAFGPGLTVESGILEYIHE